MNTDGPDAPPPHDPRSGQQFQQQPGQFPGPQYPAQQQYPGEHQRPGEQLNPGQQYYGSQGPAGAPRRGGSGRSLLAGIALGVVAALVVGAVLVMTNVLNFGGDTSDAGDTRPIELPEKLGSYTDVVELLRTNPRLIDNYDIDLDAGQLEEFFRTNAQRAGDAYHQSYGAPAGARAYAGQDIFALVIGVRASSVSPPLGFATSPEQPELADLQRLENYGQVECVILDSSAFAPPPSEGQTPTGTPTSEATTDNPSGPATGNDEESGTGGEPLTDTESASWCRRSSDTLTVVVQGGAISDGSTEQTRQHLVELTDAAFGSLAG